MFIFLFIILSSFAAYRFHALTFSGAAASVFAGGIIYYSFGLKGLVPLGLFFVSSCILSRWKKEQKQVLNNILEKTGERDAIQVFANSGAAVLASLLNLFDPNYLWYILLTISFASANADTWASEIGSLSQKKPLFLFPPHFVERGTSGAVSLLGTFASFLGSLFVVFGTFVMTKSNENIFWFSVFFGFAGAFADTVMGCLLQAKYQCTICKAETEKRIHCGNRTVQTKGVSWLNNDSVNFLSILIATILAYFSLDKL